MVGWGWGGGRVEGVRVEGVRMEVEGRGGGCGGGEEGYTSPKHFGLVSSLQAKLSF